MTTIEM